MLGPNTVARFRTLILLMSEWDWTSSRNLPGKQSLTPALLGAAWHHTQPHPHVRTLAQLASPTCSEGAERPPGSGLGDSQRDMVPPSAWREDT